MLVDLVVEEDILEAMCLPVLLQEIFLHQQHHTKMKVAQVLLPVVPVWVVVAVAVQAALDSHMLVIQVLVEMEERFHSSLVQS
tara:strand:- start:330 stop:578 length:249 start_codon:yes stop_codon:yes gene_type:complete